MANFMSPSQRMKLAILLNRQMNIPLLSENAEQDICEKMVTVLDSAIEARIPDEMLNGLNDADIQVTDVVADALKANLVPVLADVIAFPFIPTSLKRALLGYLVDILVDVMASATTIDERLDELLRATAT